MRNRKIDDLFVIGGMYNDSGSMPQIPVSLIYKLIDNYKIDYESYRQENNFIDLPELDNIKIKEILFDRMFDFAWVNLMKMVSRNYDYKFLEEFMLDNKKMSED